MNTESRDSIPMKEQRQLWAEEYSSITHRLAASTARVWNAMLLFVGGAVAAAALILVGPGDSFFAFIGTYVVCVGIVIMLWLFVNWFVRGERRVRKVLNERQDEVEKELGFYSGRYFRQLDYKREEGQWPDEFDGLPCERRQTLETLDSKYRTPPLTARGWAFIDWAIRTTMLLWAAVILVAFARWLCSIQPSR